MLPQTGYGSIDDDHDELLQLTGALLDVPDEGLVAAFEQDHALMLGGAPVLLCR